MVKLLKRIIKLECRICNHIFFWTFIIMFFSFLPYLISKQNFWNLVFENLVYSPLDMLAVYVTIYWLIPKFLLKKKIFTFIFYVFLIIIFLFVNSIYLKKILNPLFGKDVPDISYVYVFYSSTLVASFIIGIAIFFKLMKHYNQLKFEKVELENINLQSELKILKTQITPHFLFNILNNIDELIYIDREKASKAIYHLSDILRGMLNNMAQEKILLEQEIKYIQHFIELAKLTFSSPDFIRFVVNGSSKGKQIAPMLFTPVIENAIKYANRKAELPVIDIEFIISVNSIRLITKNKMKTETNNSVSTGIGLSNLRKRLDYIYLNKHKLQIYENNLTFIVDLWIEL